MAPVTLHRSTQGGIVLDLVFAAMFLLLAAFVLELLGVDLIDLLSGAGRFFGL